MAEQKITVEQVKKIAKLVKLNITDEELEKYSEKFTDALTYINILNELDTNNVPETYQVNGLTNVFQTEKNKVTLAKKEALQNAKEVIRGLFVTEGVFDRE